MRGYSHRGLHNPEARVVPCPKFQLVWQQPDVAAWLRDHTDVPDDGCSLIILEQDADPVALHVVTSDEALLEHKL
eukprot:CAMPEP_0197636016 /NCGR_PEP_ID=MMETSP1338-20131121/11658_1 /TAXON_ID=43686 ORGANISM="Pelagodinium beii, Strain RCC1491" /NCGR_SAMPLE_ID=MMETSP1338 /ASSEMBLY_ACC=CAM_ASM_000754 /LENGTH=74 /DNA_ID=CAMNT_0043208175 /DNA_START=163 /DNA_END=387 /DNA_ORIENTATION=-